MLGESIPLNHDFGVDDSIVSKIDRVLFLVITMHNRAKFGEDYVKTTITGMDKKNRIHTCICKNIVHS